jgi:signal peptidase II
MRALTKLELRRLALSIFIVFATVAVDQWVKVIAFNSLRGRRPMAFLADTVVIEYAENRGAFLSLGAALSESFRFWIFVVGVFAILGYCIYTLLKSLRHLPSVIALALVIAGGIGNLIDRVMQGYVVDYVHMGFGSLRTGVFNIADVAISGGLILLVLLQYFSSADKEAQ